MVSWVVQLLGTRGAIQSRAPGTYTMAFIVYESRSSRAVVQNEACQGTVPYCRNDGLVIPAHHIPHAIGGACHTVGLEREMQSEAQ